VRYRTESRALRAHHVYLQETEVKEDT